MGKDHQGHNLKGVNKYFNSVTLTGRANVARATYLGFFLIGSYFYFNHWRKPKVPVLEPEPEFKPVIVYTNDPPTCALPVNSRPIPDSENFEKFCRNLKQASED